jgi:DNA repair protein RecO (recombination protein O)
MTETATGVVLRTWPLTETSLIIHWLTPDLGRLATAAKGARRPKSPFRGKLDLFFLAEFSFSRSPRSSLHNLREVGLRETHSALREDLGRLEQASYAAALIEQVTEAETPLPAIFELMRGLLGALVSGPTQPQTLFAFELKLLQDLGLQPDLEQTRLSPGVKQIVRALSQSAWNSVGRVKPSAVQTAELTHFLHGFLEYHFGKVPRGRPSL